MSFVIVPATVTSAASDLASLGLTIDTATSAAARPRTGIAAAAGDEVSAQIAALFGTYAHDYQALSAEASAFHAQFVQALNSGAGMYAGAEAANASPLQTLEQDILNVINAPTNVLLGRPLIGPGASGAPGSGTAGGAGGILWGRGRLRATLLPPSVI
jgi:PE family